MLHYERSVLSMKKYASLFGHASTNHHKAAGLHFRCFWVFPKTSIDSTLNYYVFCLMIGFERVVLSCWRWLMACGHIGYDLHDHLDTVLAVFYYLETGTQCMFGFKCSWTCFIIRRTEKLSLASTGLYSYKGCKLNSVKKVRLIITRTEFQTHCCTVAWLSRRDIAVRTDFQQRLLELIARLSCSRWLSFVRVDDQHLAFIQAGTACLACIAPALGKTTASFK